MAQLEEYLKSILTGGMSGLQSGQASSNKLREAIMTKQIEASLQPKEWKPRTQEEYLETKRAEAGIISPMKATQEKKALLQVQDLENKQSAATDIRKLNSENVMTSALDFSNTIKEVKNGKKYFGAAGPIPTLNPWGYERKEWEANINKLLSQKVVDLMNNMKQASRTGATGFGQLNKSELTLLQNASTALNKGLSPDQAMKYLDQMETLSNKIINKGVEQSTGIKQIGDIPVGYERRRYKDGTIKDVPIGSR